MFHTIFETIFDIRATMGDISTVVTKPKEGGSSSISCPMLSTTNYTVWAIHMKILLRIHKVWEVVENESNEADKNDIAIGRFFQSILEAFDSTSWGARND